MAKNHKTNVAVGTIGGAAVGNMFGIKPEQIALGANWLVDKLGTFGALAIVFNIVTAGAMYLMFRFFAHRDQEKRLDIKEAFAMANSTAHESQQSMDRYTEALTKFRVMLATQGYNEDVVEPIQSQEGKKSGLSLFRTSPKT